MLIERFQEELEQLSQCFDHRKYQQYRETNTYPWNKFTEHIPIHSGQQIKDKVRNLHFSWVRQQEETKKEAINNGKEFEEVVFQDLDLYMGELQQKRQKKKHQRGCFLQLTEEKHAGQSSKHKKQKKQGVLLVMYGLNIVKTKCNCINLVYN